MSGDNYIPTEGTDVELLGGENIQFDEAASRSVARGSLRYVALGAVSVAFLVAFATVGMKFAAKPEEADVEKTIMLPASNEMSPFDHAFDPCVAGQQQWSSKSTLSPWVKLAAEKAFLLANAERVACGVGAFVSDSSSFLKGRNGTHTLHAQQKYDSACGSETYHLSFHIEAGTTSTDFWMEVNRDMTTQAWTLLKADPPVCSIHTGSASQPQGVDVKANFIVEAGQFAAGQLLRTLRDKQCGLDEAWADATAEVVGAIVQVQAGLKIHMNLKFTLGDTDKTVQGLFVLEECHTNTCVKKLTISGGDACDAWNGAGRRLVAAMGSHPEDATEIWRHQRELLSGRQLSSVRQPLMWRHIKSGNVAETHDPRDNECFKKITVYNQGTCGSCYANGVAQMVGIRKCLIDKSRRLAEENTTRNAVEKHAAPRQMRADDGASCLAQSWGSGYTCSNSKQYCSSYQSIMSKCCSSTCNVKPCSCNSKGVQGKSRKYCYLEDAHCELKSGAVSTKTWAYCTDMSCPQPCEDTPGWSAFGNNQYTCSFFAGKCDKYKDYGQETNCRKSCGNCPSGQQSFNDNPWHGAWYQYMPSTGQMTPCAMNPGGTHQGCGGGNLDGVWNQWMKDMTTPLQRMGQSCMPYNFKCWTSSGVVNAAASGQCSKFSDYQLWHKPCHCIGSSNYPTTYSCPNYAPSSDCGVPVPYAMFLVSTSAQGLTPAEGVLNMQRHIAEYGPIWVSFDCTSGFQNQDWKKNPIYTGGGTSEGGHVVNAVGWGTSGGTPYWIIRNSWGAAWADKGYCKFKRGVNLDGIESRGVGASMPVGNYADWSAPVCEYQGWSMSYSWRGCCTLTKMPTTIKLSCNKAAKVTVFVSYRITNHAQIQKGVSGNYFHHTAQGAGDFSLPPINMLNYDFGLKNGDSWLQIVAEDASGNKATKSSFITLNAINGMTSKSR
mmetsp:Transcript_87057/g.137398  ORF Transcript_87057/g.137398 Transcript_87057/m.137398 type:complete len:941 (+) Transcript_87057:70-2892(+)